MTTNKELPPLNEDTDSVITVIENVESLYLEMQRLIQIGKNYEHFRRLVTRFLSENYVYLKAMAECNMRKVSPRRVALFYWYEGESRKLKSPMKVWHVTHRGGDMVVFADSEEEARKLAQALLSEIEDENSDQILFSIHPFQPEKPTAYSVNNRDY
jgi:hypothetical protein